MLIEIRDCKQKSIQRSTKIACMELVQTKEEKGACNGDAKHEGQDTEMLERTERGSERVEIGFRRK